MTLRTSENHYPPAAVALTKWYTHARVVVVVTPISPDRIKRTFRRPKSRTPPPRTKTQHGSGVLRSIKMCSLVLFVMWISPEPPSFLFFFFFLSPPPRSCLSSASPSAGVSNIEIRNITMRGEKRTQQQGIKLAQSGCTKKSPLTLLCRRRELVDDDRPAHVNRDCHENL